MYSKHLEDYIVKETEKISDAYWKYSRHKTILIAIDENNNFSGILTSAEFDNKRSVYNPNAPVSTIMNKNCKTIQNNSNTELLYGFARNIFADNLNINHIPVLENSNIVDIFSRTRAFWLNYKQSGKLPYNYYATIIQNAINTAKLLNINSISVIEFGVAGGNGLLAMEFHARELSRLHNINVEVYGFDTGEGLPRENAGYKDRIHSWGSGNYKMDVEKLQNKLRSSKLILGDIRNTLDSFIEKYNPAPIGAISIDVDFYSSTMPILNFLSNIKDEHILPRTSLYFDDLVPQHEMQGEDLAIKEFNEKNNDRKISPEDSTTRIKLLNIFSHSKYNTNSNKDFQLPLRSGIGI